MEPRKSRATKWTALPKDYTKQVVEALRESFQDEIKSGKFIVEGRIYPDELLINMGFLENGRLRQTNFQLSAEYKAGKDDVVKLLNLIMDVGATMLEELFASTDDHEFPRTWQPFEVEKKLIYIQFSAENTDLEKKADKFLGAAGKKLIKEDNEEDEELAGIKRKLGVDDAGGEEED
jgi:hypothetical protein